MKATGIVRRIDDLGRVVIPKEIRRTMRIREGDPLEIYTDREGEVIFKKYSPIGEMADFAADYCESLHKSGKLAAFICDRDQFVAVAGLPKKEFLERKIPEALERGMLTRDGYRYQRGEDGIELVPGYYLCALCPVYSEGDLRGAVGCATARPAEPSETEAELCKTAAHFLSKQISG